MKEKYDENDDVNVVLEELDRVSELFYMMRENVAQREMNEGDAGCGYPKNHNASKTAILNQITTLRNELLVLKDLVNG